MTTQIETTVNGRGAAARIALALAVAAPAVVVRLAGADLAPVAAMVVFGAAVLAAVALLMWAAEAARVDISGSLALAILALVAILPEYAVDIYFAYTAGHNPDYAAYATANMTGANRLLIGVAWPLLVGFAIFAVRRRRVRGERDAVSLEPHRRTEIIFLAAATVYALVIPLTGRLAWYDTLVLGGLFGLYLWRIRGKEEGVEELAGVAATVAAQPTGRRRSLVVALFVAAGVVILAAAEPFGDSLVSAGADLGIDEFLLVQWLAPIASEAPEVIVAVTFALRGRADDGMGALLAAKLNQWTLLIACLPVAFYLGGGETAGLPLDARQTEELVLTTAQTLLGVAVLADLRLTRGEALLLFGLFAAQFVLPAPNIRYVIAAAYTVLAVLLLIRQRRHLPDLVKALKYTDLSYTERRSHTHVHHPSRACAVDGPPHRPSPVLGGCPMSDACGCDDDKPTTTEAEADEREPERFWQVTELRAAAVAGLLLAAGLIAGWADAPRAVELGLQAAALAVGAWTFVPSTLRRLTKGKIGVGTLMTIAAVGAVILGEVGEAAMLAFLYSISEGLEEYSLARTRRGLRALLALVPAEATVRRDGVERTISPADLRVGDVMIVRPGERVATDGIIRAGRTALDVSAITGESMPVEAEPGSEVYAGSINGTGVLDVEVTRTAEDNSLARIVRIVEAEQARKGASQRLADRIAKPLVPGIMIAGVLIAALGSLFGDPATWIERALVVLVAASPCALAISVPVTVVAAVGAASRIGVLVKGGAALEALGTIRGVALDKTGTLTRNQPAVIEVAATGAATRERVLELAAALEARSEHPLARAILAAVDTPQPATDVEAVTGAGLVGTVDGRTVRLGRPGWLQAGDLADTVQRMQQAGATAVLVEDDGTLVGAIAVRDELRPEAAEVVARLRRDGYHLSMLTGDNHATAAAIAQQAGITDVHADLRPEDKARIIDTLRTARRTAMVGDGVNDAPALATADLGIAMGAMGTDVAIETADVALMGEDLRHLPQALGHARRARTIMLQNVGLSLAIITALMPLALLGILGLAAVVLVHEIAEVVIIANGVRAGRARALQPLPTTAADAATPSPTPVSVG